MTKTNALIIVGIAILAGTLRFYMLGSWPFAGDETATVAEERILAHDVPANTQGQFYRLPRLVPVGYWIIHASHMLFGETEFGMRALLSLLGTVTSIMIFILLRGLVPQSVAIVTSLLTALNPEHIFQSQQARFYIVAHFFATLALLTGARVLSRRPTLNSIICCASSILAMLSHTIMGMILFVAIGGIAAASYVGNRKLPSRVSIVFAVGTLALAAVAFFHVIPLVRDWNSSESWGYSVPHAILASVVMIGWPFALLALIGLTQMITVRTAQHIYWTIVFLSWGGATVTLPLLTAFHPSYVFPLLLGPLVPAAFGIGVIFQTLRERTPMVALSCIASLPLVETPRVVSHYSDGSRADFRIVSSYIDSQWHENDRLAGYSVGLVKQYAKRCCTDTVPLHPHSIAELDKLTMSTNRTWVVIESTRGGIHTESKRWLLLNCIHRLNVRKRRFDYADYAVDVFECKASQRSAGSTARTDLDQRDG